MTRKENLKYYIKHALYVLAFILIMYGNILFHELGHAIVCLSLGGTLHEFGITWDFNGCIVWSFENVPKELQPQTIILVMVSGGIGAALFFMILSFKTRWFMVPAFFSLLDGYAEAMYQTDARFSVSVGVVMSVFFICAKLHDQFIEDTDFEMAMIRLKEAKR